MFVVGTKDKPLLNTEMHAESFIGMINHILYLSLFFLSVCRVLCSMLVRVLASPAFLFASSGEAACGISHCRCYWLSY